jgi:hypothetical protein
MKFVRIGGVVAVLLVQWGSSASAVNLKNRTIDANLNRAAALSPGSGPSSHWILQFKDFPSASVRGKLAQRGVRVLEYLPDSTLIVSFRRPPGRQSPDLRGLNITWTGQLTAADRTAPGLETASAFLVVLHGDVPKADAERLLEGFQVMGAPGLLPNHFLVAADQMRLPQLAAQDEVSYIAPGGMQMAVRRRLSVCPGPISVGYDFEALRKNSTRTPYAGNSHWLSLSRQKLPT